jgi:hypothetical protein
MTNQKRRTTENGMKENDSKKVKKLKAIKKIRSEVDTFHLI